MIRSITTALCVCWLLLTSPDYAFAYLDPGSGSMLLQALLGGVAGVVALCKLYWRQLRTWIGFSEEKQTETAADLPSNAEPDSPLQESQQH